MLELIFLSIVPLRGYVVSSYIYLEVEKHYRLNLDILASVSIVVVQQVHIF